jgi:UTP--glucose-1-phosphate uridylyltransferase
VPWEEVSRYGVVDATSIAERVYKANRLVEKPKREDAPSNLAILGRYILTPRIFDMLGEQHVGVGGEIQLTDAIARLSEVERIIAYDFEGQRHDVGEKMGFIQTTIHYALQHEDLKEDLLLYLKQIIDSEAAKAVK